MKTVTGAAIAAAAATLILSGTVVAPTAFAQEEKGHCNGVNACKGQSACATPDSSCKGQNECKGLGWLAMTKTECDQAGGRWESGQEG